MKPSPDVLEVRRQPSVAPPAPRRPSPTGPRLPVLPPPADVLARAADKTVPEKLALFVAPTFRAVVHAMASDPEYAAMFEELVARPPANLAVVLQRACAQETLSETVAQIARGAGGLRLSTPIGKGAAELKARFAAARAAGELPALWASFGARSAA